jgi:hypothetical protein
MRTFGEIDLVLDGDTVTIAFDRDADWWTDTPVDAKHADFIQTKVNAEFEGAGYMRLMDGSMRRTRCRSLL